MQYFQKSSYFSFQKIPRNVLWSEARQGLWCVVVRPCCRLPGEVVGVHPWSCWDYQPGQLGRTEVALPPASWGTFQPQLCCFLGMWFSGSLELKGLSQPQWFNGFVSNYCFVPCQVPGKLMQVVLAVVKSTEVLLWRALKFSCLLLKFPHCMFMLG